MRGQYLKSDNPKLLFLYHSIDAPQNAKDGDFRSQHPHAAAALGFTLVGAGAILVLPAVGAAILGAVGFGSGGVAAGLLFLLDVSPLRHWLILTCRKPRGFSAIGDIWGCDRRRVFCPSVSRRNGGGIPTRDARRFRVGRSWGVVPCRP